jgi:hypothetical protein
MTAINPTMTNLKRAVDKAGATLDVAEGVRWITANVDAPDGMIWDANGCTTLVATWMIGDAKFRAESIADVLERIAMGFSENYGENE